MGMTPLIDQALMSYETVCFYVMQWYHNFISLNSFGHVNTTVKFLAIFKLCFFFPFFALRGPDTGLKNIAFKISHLKIYILKYFFSSLLKIASKLQILISFFFVSQKEEK